MQISGLLTKFRTVFDYEKTNKVGDVFTYVGDDYYNLAFDNASEIVSIKLNDDILESGIANSLDTNSNAVYIDGTTFTNGDTITIVYKYTDYSDEELSGYLRESIMWLSLYSGKTYLIDTESDNLVVPTPDPSEQNLIIMIAMILIKPYEQSYSLPNYKVVYPNRKNKDDRIKDLVNNGLKFLGTVQFY